MIWLIRSNEAMHIFYILRAMRFVYSCDKLSASLRNNIYFPYTGSPFRHLHVFQKMPCVENLIINNRGRVMHNKEQSRTTNNVVYFPIEIIIYCLYDCRHAHKQKP